MTVINLNEIQQDLPGYMRRVQTGETFVIVEAAQPIAELRPVSAGRVASRPFGLCAGQFRVPDDFNAPLPDDLVRQFEGA